MDGRRRIRLKGALVLALAATIVFGQSVEAGPWWENVKIKGDLRYRHEMIDKDGSDARHRHRVRARLGLFGEVSAYTKVGVQLATGSDDPVSTNQTLDGASSTKNVGIDLAYFEATHPDLEGVKLQGGKFKNPFFKPGKSELIWDSDWNPEGGVLTFKHDNENVSVFLLGSGLWIDERSKSDDSYMMAAQGVVRFKLNEEQSSFALGGSVYSYANVKKSAPFYEADDAKGNTTYKVVDTLVGDFNDSSIVTTEYYTNDYELLNGFIEFTHKFEKTPVTFMAEYVTNTSLDSLNTGWLAGMRLGKAKKPGSWEFRYIYRRVEADAVLGAFTDSDFRGGGTDAKGHEIGGAVMLADNTAFKVSYFNNKIGLTEDNREKDFDRLQVDMQLKF